MLIYLIASSDDNLVILSTSKEAVEAALGLDGDLQVNTWDTDANPICKVSLDIISHD